MDVRTIMAAVAFMGALAAGLVLGWWHGPSLAPDQADAQTGSIAGTPSPAGTGVAMPLESAGSGGPSVDRTSVRPSADPAVAPEVSVTTTATAHTSAYTGDVLAIGDSVLAGAAACLKRRGINVNAQQSRRITDAMAILERRADRLPARIIVHLGTNGGAMVTELDAIMGILGPDRIVLWSTIQLPDDPTRYTYERATNEAIAGLADRYPNVRIFDWQAATTLHPEWLYAEGIHMTPEGCRGYTELVEPQVRAP